MGDRCRCCPHGIHIDLSFVEFAEQVAHGKRTTPTNSRAHQIRRDEQRAMRGSPVGSLFSDSIENMMSDLEESISANARRLHGSSHSSHSTMVRNQQNFEANGYLSDSTGYRTNPLTMPSAFATVGNGGPPKPPNKASSKNQTQNTAYVTALGRTLSAARMRPADPPMAESPTPRFYNERRRERDYSPLPSRDTPTNELDPSHPLSPTWRRRAFNQTPTGGTASTYRSELERNYEGWNTRSELRQEPTNLPPLAPTSSHSTLSEMHSLRRGREPDPITPSTRTRYYSSSPKMPRRLVPAAPLMESSPDFATPARPAALYPEQASTPPSSLSSSVVSSSLDAGTQSVFTPAAPSYSAAPTFAATPSRCTSDASCWTGPPTPAKPCTDCIAMRARIGELEERLAYRPPLVDAFVQEAPEVCEAKAQTDAKPATVHFGVETDRPKLSNTGSDAHLVATADFSMATDRVLLEGREAQTEEMEKEEEEEEVKKETVDAATAMPVVEPVDQACDTLSLQHVSIDSACQTDTPSPSPDIPTFAVTPPDEEPTMEESWVPLNASPPTPVTPEKAPLSAEHSLQTSPISDPPPDYDILTDEELEMERVVYEEEAEEKKEEKGEKRKEEEEKEEKTEERKDEEEKKETRREAPKFGHRAEEKEEKTDHIQCRVIRNEEKAAPAEEKIDVLVEDGDSGINDDKEEEEDKEGEKKEEEEKGTKEEEEDEEEEQIVLEEGEEGEARRLGEEEVESLKKLLVSDEPKAFVRGGVFRSLRETRTKSTEDEEAAPESSGASDKASGEALKGKLALKKPSDSPAVVSKIPEPRDARIPRPKFSKYAADHTVKAETEDEEDEAVDRLTPLRSELRSLGSWPGAASSTTTTSTSSPSASSIPPPIQEETGSDAESDASSGSYETNEREDEGPFEPSEPLIDAIKMLDRHVTGEKQKQEAVEWAMKLVQHEWLKTAAKRSSRVDRVAGFICSVKAQSDNLHEFIINIDDANANTALHYAVSHGNLPVASLLLDYNAQVDCANRAGYSPLMLAALVELSDPAEINIIHRLFRAGEVNARAQPHGQTALMLAVSHGKLETAKLLLECGGDVNVQDEEGSTALMCAAEHGHKALVKMLLAHPGCDASLADCDSSTALSIAVENGHRDIGLLLYAHQKRHNENA